MAYCTQTDILNNIDAQNLNAMVDDWSQGASNTALSSVILTNILQLASDKADSYVCSIYQTPFSPAPKKIIQASIIFACEMLYARRLTPAEENPFKDQSKYWTETLISIGNGAIPMDVSFTRAFQPIIARTNKMRDDGNLF